MGSSYAKAANSCTVEQERGASMMVAVCCHLCLMIGEVDFRFSSAEDLDLFGAILPTGIWGRKKSHLLGAVEEGWLA